MAIWEPSLCPQLTSKLAGLFHCPEIRPRYALGAFRERFGSVGSSLFARQLKCRAHVVCKSFPASRCKGALVLSQHALAGPASAFRSCVPSTQGAAAPQNHSFLRLQVTFHACSWPCGANLANSSLTPLGGSGDLLGTAGLKISCFRIGPPVNS